MKNNLATRSHQELLDFWINNSPYSSDKIFEEHVEKSAYWIRNYLQNLKSSKDFNETILRKIDHNSVSTLSRTVYKNSRTCRSS